MQNFVSNSNKQSDLLGSGNAAGGAGAMAGTGAKRKKTKVLSQSDR